MKESPTVDYKALITSAPSLYLILLPDLTIIEVSQTYAQATMTIREEIIGKGIFEVFPDNPDDENADGVSNLSASLNYVLKNKEAHTMAIQRYDIKKPNGEFEKRYWSPLNKPVFDDENNIKYIIHRAEDVTEYVQIKNEQLAKDHFTDNLISKISDMEIELYKRNHEIQKLNSNLEKKMEESVRLAETNFKEIFEKSVDGIYVQDIDSGEYVEINDRAAELRGCSKEELKTLPKDRFISDNPNYSFEKALSYVKKAADGEPQSYEWLSKRADGTPTWFEVNLKRANISGKDRVIAFFREINHRKEAEQKLITSERRFKAILEQFPYPVVNFTPDGYYIFTNKAWETMWEDTREMIRGYNILQDERLMNSNIGAAVTKAFKGSIVVTEPYYGDPEAIGKKGSKRWLIFTFFPLKDESGKILEIVAIHQDITENKKIEDEIKQSLILTTFQKKQLEDFCNIVSHNLRSPLINISMLVDIMMKSDDLDELKIFQDKLSKSTSNLNEIFNHLVESIQIKEDTEISKKKLHFDHYLSQTTELLQAQIEATNATIVANFTEYPSIIYSEKYLSSILQNLISNALKYHSPQRKPVIKLETRKNDNSIVLAVSDNGLGIDMNKHKDNLFKIRKVFHSAPDAKGFGLFITKTQIDAMGDSIWIESNPDQGTTFFIEFKNQIL